MSDYPIEKSFGSAGEPGCSECGVIGRGAKHKQTCSHYGQAMTTAAPPEKMSDAAFAERLAKIKEWTNGKGSLLAHQVFWLIDQLEAARLAPRVGDALHALWPWLEHRNSCGRAVQDDLPVEVKCSCGLDDVIAALSAPPAASADERTELSASVYQDLPGDPDRWLCDMIADHILGLGYRKRAAQGVGEMRERIMAMLAHDYEPHELIADAIIMLFQPLGDDNG